MNWLAFLLSAGCILIGFMGVGNLIFGLVVAYGFMRGTRCADQEDFSVALAMIFFGAPLCIALSLLCWWAGGQIAG